MLTVADRGRGGDKICQNLADVICERSHNEKFDLLPYKVMSRDQISFSPITCLESI